MSVLSSYTLFHFTHSFDNLKGILKEGINYGLFAEKLPVEKLAYFVRGISFCNIPLSMITEHVKWYGPYAIGLKRSMMRERGASPVFYVHSKTKVLPRGDNALEEFKDNRFLCYLKQHYGKQFYNGTKEYRFKKFYDEKEWRIIAGESKVEKYINQKSLSDRRLSLEKYFKSITPLVLKPDEIEYIILEKPAILKDFIGFVEKDLKIDSKEYLPKILYYTQIKKDF